MLCSLDDGCWSVVGVSMDWVAALSSRLGNW